MIETIFAVIYMSVFVLLILTVFIVIITMFKNDNTLKNHLIIVDAIHSYCTELIQKGMFDIKNPPVYYDDMEDYELTFRRFWDWGYKRILPPEKFELIKPYIEKDKKI